MTVMITVTDVNEAPVVSADEMTTFAEVGETDLVVGTYTADDPETLGDDATEVFTWSVAGPDGGKFNIGNETDGTLGQLKFKAEPNYEKPTDANKDNVYEVTGRRPTARRPA